jgi:hypothetical protein
MNFKSALVGAIVGVLLAAISCENLNQQKKATSDSSAPAVAVQPRNRYELHPIRNGTFYGTALLDQETGRVWTLASNSKAGKVTDVEFSEVLVYPAPQR